MENEKTKKEIKEWLFELENETFEVHTKDGIFIMDDIQHKKLVSARKRGEKSNTIQECILAEMIISKDGDTTRIGELGLLELKSSSVMRLMYVMNTVFGVEDFLEKPNNE